MRTPSARKDLDNVHAVLYYLDLKNWYITGLISCGQNPRHFWNLRSRLESTVPQASEDDNGSKSRRSTDNGSD
jgi:hypothetical protein